MSYLIIGLVVFGLIVWVIVSLFEWLGKTAQELGARLSVDKHKNIVARNHEIIEKCLDDMYAGDRPYYVENQVRDCIGKIAEREGRSDLAPKWREWLSQWERRSDIPKEYLELKDHLRGLFSTKHQQLLDKQRAEQERRERKEEEEIERRGQALLDRNKALVDKFLEITERKVSVIDDYGDENWEIVPDEIVACLKKISQRESAPIDWLGYAKKSKRGHYTHHSIPDEYAWLQKKLASVFREYHEAKQSRPAGSAYLNDLSGVEFETWIARLLKDHGFDDVRGTPPTGDQGADLIAKKSGKTIIIQAKRHQGAVGNRAVQEVIGAVIYYSGDEGWVITNSTFTPSAKELAHKSNIKLIDGRTLANFKVFLSELRL